MKGILLILLTMIFFSSDQAQDKPSVVNSVDLKKYAGTWYEIARLPNSFERKLKCITANYTLREDGKITVINKGHYLSDPSKINSARGVAWVPDKNYPAKLKVQFFWPFTGNYWIIYLEKDYRYVLVGDPSFKYLWILSREKKMEDAIYQMLLKTAVDNGFDIQPLIRVEHDCNQ
jgi:apolipoprotein D and lipocalin family protein